MHTFYRINILGSITLLNLCSAAAIVEKKNGFHASSHPLERAAAAASYTLPQNSNDPVLRAAALGATRLGFTYGAPVAGGPYYPSGALGIARAVEDQAAIQLEVLPEGALAAKDTAAATAGALLDKVWEKRKRKQRLNHFEAPLGIYIYIYI